MTWWELLPLLGAGALILLLPGLLILGAAGIRGFGLWAGAAPVSISVFSLTAVAAGFAGLRWSLLPVLGATLIAAAAAYPAGRGVRRRWPGAAAPAVRVRRPVIVAAAAAVLAAAAVVGYRFTQIIGAPENISQTFDNVFHLNAIRFILDSGSASSLTLGRMTNADQALSFYPAAWHGFVSLLVQLSGSSIPASVSAANILIAALIWPAGCIYLVTRITGVRAVPVLVAGVLSAGFGSFPYLMIDFGVLYPYFLALALVPCALGAAVSLLGTRPVRVRTAAGTVLILALPGVALAHPSALVVLLALSAPAVLDLFIRAAAARHRLRKPARAHLWPAAGLAAYALGSAVLWYLLRPDPAAATWPKTQSIAQAFGEALTSAPMGRPLPWLIFGLTALGLLHCLRTPALRWVAGSFLVSMVLFIVVSGFGPSRLRSLLTGVWYNDSYRLAAVLPIAAVLVASIGASLAIDRLARRSRLLEHPRLGPAAAALLVAAGLVLTQGNSVRAEVRAASVNYGYTPDSPLVSANEKALLDRLDEHVPEDDAVIGSPWSGASLVYMFTGRESLTPHMFGEYSPDVTTVLERLDEAGEDPAVCAAVQRLNSYYVLDFGSKEVHGGRHPFPGLKNPRTQEGLSLVDRQGGAALYKVTACG